jgi:esterase/lipase
VLFRDFVDTLGYRLLAWATLSVAVGLPLLALGDAFWRGFGLQALAWGAIDGLIGYAGRRHARRIDVGPAAAADRRAEARFVRRLLWANAGLDVLYVAGGALLWAGAGSDAWLAGTGAGIVVQGLFLLVFDLAHARWVPGDDVALPTLPVFDDPAHDPIRLVADPGVPVRGIALLLHGFGATPAQLRPLAAALAADGWAVEAPLLPGFGRELPRLLETRFDDWRSAAIAAAGSVRERQGDGRLALVGYSMGGALALAAAGSIRPDALVLLAPFVWDVKPWQRVLGPVLRVAIPHGFRPFGRTDFDDPKVQADLRGIFGDLDLDDPAVRGALRTLPVPRSFVESIIAGTVVAAEAARSIRVPVLVAQGERDTASRPAVTRRVADTIPGPVTRLSLDADHDLLGDATPAGAAVREAVVGFLGGGPGGPRPIRGGR